jgi:hypothetical protein
MRQLLTQEHHNISLLYVTTFEKAWLSSATKLPQEIARSHPTGIRWTKKCDVFSLGCESLAILEGQKDVIVLHRNE